MNHRPRPADLLVQINETRAHFIRNIALVILMVDPYRRSKINNWYRNCKDSIYISTLTDNHK